MKVLLIHGLSRTPLSLFSLERRLWAAGYHTEQFGYAAFMEPYDRIVERLKTRLQAIGNRESYAVVAHSLRGLLTRSALGAIEMIQPQHIVMMGTPNRQPKLATYAWQMLLPYRHSN